MAAFLVAFAAAGAIILALHMMLGVGVILNFRKDSNMRRHPPAPQGMTAEVIVAARNEEHVLPALLEDLAAQADRSCLFLFVDDRSTDRTGEILDRFAAAAGPRARVIHNAREPDGLTGKQAALDLALEASRGDILYFTDADCRVPPTWVESTRGYFADPAVGIVLGRIELEGGASLLARFQAFEQPLINQYNLGNAGISLPMGCFGNNMALRGTAAREVGGFHGLGYSVTEDATLLTAVTRNARWKARVSTLPGTTVVTRAQETWKGYVDQHTRWNAGGFFSRDPATRVAYFFITGYLIACMLALPFGFLDTRITLLSLNAFVSIGVLGFLSGLYPGKKKARYYLGFLPNLFLFGYFYSFVSLRALAGRSFDWKGSKIRARNRGWPPAPPRSSP